MHPRRQKLASWIALQTATAAAASSSHAIAELRLFPLREPMSGRSYTVLRLRTRGSRKDKRPDCGEHGTTGRPFRGAHRCPGTNGAAGTGLHP